MQNIEDYNEENYVATVDHFNRFVGMVENPIEANREVYK